MTTTSEPTHTIKVFNYDTVIRTERLGKYMVRTLVGGMNFSWFGVHADEYDKGVFKYPPRGIDFSNIPHIIEQQQGGTLEYIARSGK